MSHGAVTWRETPSDRIQYGAGDTRRMKYDFFGVYELTSPGTPAPTTASAAITAAESAGANLRVDGTFSPPSTLPTIGSGSAPWVLASMSVERAKGTNENTDVIWIFSCELEAAYKASTTEPFVQVTQQATAVNVSAFRILPTIPTDDFADVASNNTIWHGTTDISGTKVDWASQPIQYALPIRNLSITVQRPAPHWTTTGTRDLGAVNVIASDAQYIGKRNTLEMDWMGDAGEILLVGINATPLNQGLYNVSYQFRWHPWKHALQVPYMVGAAYAKDENPDNATRLQNGRIWWSQPHIEGVDFKAELDITTDELTAAGIS